VREDKGVGRLFKDIELDRFYATPNITSCHVASPTFDWQKSLALLRIPKMRSKRALMSNLLKLLKTEICNK
jgi:hypothetical protein